MFIFWKKAVKLLQHRGLSQTPIGFWWLCPQTYTLLLPPVDIALLSAFALNYFIPSKNYESSKQKMFCLCFSCTFNLAVFVSEGAKLFFAPGRRVP